MSKALKIKDVNLLLSYYRKPQKIKSKKPVFFKVLFPIFLTLGMGSIFMIYLNNILDLNKQIITLESYTNSTENQALYKESQDIIANVSRYSSVATELRTQSEKIKNATKIEKIAIDKINSCLNESMYVNNISFAQEISLINISVGGPTEMDGNEFVKRLLSLNYFEDVSYSGYSINQSTNAYEFTVGCRLKAGEIDE